MAIELDPFIAEALAVRAAVSGVVLPERDDPIGLREFLDPGGGPLTERWKADRIRVIQAL